MFIYPIFSIKKYNNKKILYFLNEANIYVKKHNIHLNKYLLISIVKNVYLDKYLFFEPIAISIFITIIANTIYPFSLINLSKILFWGIVLFILHAELNYMIKNKIINEINKNYYKNFNYK